MICIFTNISQILKNEQHFLFTYLLTLHPRTGHAHIGEILASERLDLLWLLKFSLCFNVRFILGDKKKKSQFNNLVRKTALKGTGC